MLRYFGTVVNTNCRSPLLNMTFLFGRFINFSIVLNKKKEVESQFRCSTSCIDHAIRNNIVNVKVCLLSIELIVLLDRSF